jgi:hypothetical protein
MTMPARRRGKRPPPAEPRPSILDRRTRVVAVLLIGVAIALALWGRHKNAPPAPAPTATEPDSHETNPATPGGFGAMGMTATQTPPPAPNVASDPPPVIDNILLEKSEVCAGEENLVTVLAHTTNGTDPSLHYVIDGHMGQSFPVTLWKGENGIIGQHTVTVFGRNNVATTVPLPQYEVKSCRPTFLAAISTAVRSNTWADFDFTARVVGLPPEPTEADKQRGAGPPPVAKPFKGVAYNWSFGDGETVTTLTPVVEHNYEGREQKTEYSYYVIGVSIRSAKGESVTGRSTLALQNPSFSALAQKGIVALLISLDPRFPERDSDGKVTQHVRIWHNQPQAVTIEHASLTKYFKAAAGETKPEDVDVSSVLGTTSIPAGKEGITVTVTLDPRSEDEVFTKTWALNGKSAEGYPVLGSFSVMLPPDRPSPDAGSRVFDPMLQQKIMATKEMLGKDIVTDEDIWRLEREGAFAKLKVSPEQAAAAASAAIAAAIQKGPPSPQAPPSKGPPGPKSTAEQAALPSQSGSAGKSTK